jgi:hypothetical protein
MRTKALLLSAALVAAGVASSMAQSNVYSLNIVGYVNVPIPMGFSIVNNPLDDGLGDGNVITNVITSTNTPDQTLVYFFTPHTGFADNETYYAGFGWFPGTNHMGPGRGVFLFSPVATNITFVGQIAAGTYTNGLAGGGGGTFNMVGSIVPEALPLGVPGLAGTLGIPVTDQDIAYRYSVANFGGYDGVTYFTTYGWFDGDFPGGSGGSTNGPVLNVGEGIFLFSVAGGNWVETFSVN